MAGAVAPHSAPAAAAAVGSQHPALKCPARHCRGMLANPPLCSLPLVSAAGFCRCRSVVARPSPGIDTPQRQRHNGTCGGGGGRPQGQQPQRPCQPALRLAAQHGGAPGQDCGGDHTQDASLLPARQPGAAARPPELIAGCAVCWAVVLGGGAQQCRACFLRPACSSPLLLTSQTTLCLVCS